ncbi:MAG TPA: YdeI/OmpD-associated family protein [Flavisolibacter sp.]|nr:YdeI/OmpD-associated family protein [Flavisolibacter sp.]
MITFTTTIQKFGPQGEKTGWTYIEISPEMADQLNPGVKKSFRVKGKLDKYPIKAVALLPMGEGSFIMALNAEMRKGIKKQKGDQLSVKLELDTEEVKPSSELLEILADEPEAMKKFNALPRGHQNYFSKWIESAKTDATKAKRIVHCIRFLAAGNSFSEMIRTLKKEKEQGPVNW